MSDTTKTGNSGEHLVMAELLHQGFHAFRADRANPAFDISVYYRGRQAMVRVKTTLNDSAQWIAKKKDGTLFLEMQKRNDFVVLVDMRNGVRGAVIYIVPTHIIDRELRQCHEHWNSFPKRDGTARQRNARYSISLEGNDTPTNISRGYATKFREYRDAWRLLKRHDA
jgi:hypothetical protein